MEGIYQHYIIDLSSNNNFVQIPAMQGDGNGVRYFEVELIQNNMQYLIDVENTIVMIAGTKSDTKGILNECSISDEGYILVEITSQMSAVQGVGHYQISLLDKKKNTMLSSFPFMIITTKSAYDPSYIISSDEFGILSSKIIEVTTLTEEVSEAILQVHNLEEEVTEAESARSIAETERNDNETQRQNNEEIRKASELERHAFYEQVQIDETERISNEEERQANELLREQFASDFANAEAERVQNELERQQQAEEFATAETERQANETQRQSNEESRINSETERQLEFEESINKVNDAITLSNLATDNANNAAQNANNVSDDLIAKRDAGYFNGRDGVITNVDSGQYAFEIQNGCLYIIYNDSDPEPTSYFINEDGCLIYTI